MDPITDELRQVIARDKIRECVARVARSEDRRDAEGLRRCYWPDSTVDFGMFSGDLAAYLDWVVPGSPAVPLTQHVLGQSVIQLAGETARVETHVLSYHRIRVADDDSDMIIGGRYLDVFEGRGSEWRIRSRTMLYDWYQPLGAAVDWSQGMLGAPFSAPHFAGAAATDYSVSFFRQSR